MDEKIILILSTIAAFSFTLLSALCFMKAAGNAIFGWLGLLFFSPLLALISNLMIYFNLGNVWLYHISMLFNLSWGGYLFLIMNNLGKKYKKKVNPFLFLPSMLYLPFVVYSFFNSQPIEQIISNKLQGISLLVSSFFNVIIIVYSLTVNALCLVVEIKSGNRQLGSALKKEILSIMLVLQLFAFVPYLLNMDIIYVVLYMPVFGQLFFIYLFFRLSSQKVVYLQTLIKEKYAGFKLGEHKQLELEKRILCLLEEKKFFLADDSSLKAMAQVLDETPNRVSMIINSRFNRTYSDFINSYRIKWAIDRLTSEKNKLSIEGLAYECGFGNRNSFYQAFKKETGTTPSEYMKK